MTRSTTNCCQHERTRPATVEHSMTNDWNAVRPL